MRSIVLSLWCKLVVGTCAPALVVAVGGRRGGRRGGLGGGLSVVPRPHLLHSELGRRLVLDVILVSLRYAIVVRA
eukprot:SAG11_NODE_1838_length_4187_cov_3.622554_6_plen_75_part_00